MTRTRVVIQSRLNSSRLPGKALMTIGGMPLIELVARRASRDGHEVVVATSEEQYDTRIFDHLARVDLEIDVPEHVEVPEMLLHLSHRHERRGRPGLSPGRRCGLGHGATVRSPGRAHPRSSRSVTPW